jgi:hypothetical protein
MPVKEGGRPPREKPPRGMTGTGASGGEREGGTEVPDRGGRTPVKRRREGDDLDNGRRRQIRPERERERERGAVLEGK